MMIEEKFVKELSKCNDPVVFIGLCKGFKIPLMVGDSDEFRPFEELLNDLLDKFHGLSRKGRKELLKILTEANHANNT